MQRRVRNSVTRCLMNYGGTPIRRLYKLEFKSTIEAILIHGNELEAKGQVIMSDQ